MSFKITTDVAGQIGVNPRRIKIVSTDSYATITSAGYLNQVNTQGLTILPTDIIDIIYNYSATTNTGTYAQLLPSFTLGVITLVPSIANLFSFDVTVGQAALASSGSVTLVQSSGVKQFKIRSLQLNLGGTNFSGGSGDRLGQVTDGTTVYSLIPAATMQSLVNAQWGVTALPNPASAAINTSTVAGANLAFKYSGGTLDYTAGSLVISGIVERVA